MRLAIGVGSAFFGAAAAGLGLWLGQLATSSTPAVVTTVPTVVAAQAVPISLGPTRLIPLSLELAERELVFSYELVDEAAASFPTIFVNPDNAVVAPETWSMSTATGRIAGTTANVRATTARFPVPEGFTLDQVGSITLESYRIRLPIEHILSLRWDDTAPISLDEDIAIGVRRVIAQTSSTLVQLTVEANTDSFASAGGGFGAEFEAAPRVTGIGPDWTNVGPVDGGVQLTYVGDELSDPFTVAVVSHNWTRVERPLVMSVGGLTDG
ncbi:MAG: hypothetical protein V3R84_08520 [Acidimicrobiia bacterium]